MANARAAVRSIQDQQSSLAKATGATRKGALVYWWLTGIMSHVDDVKALYQKHDLDWDMWGPLDQRVTTAFRKTIKEVGRTLNSKGADQGYLIRLIDDNDQHLIYGVVREDRLKANEDLAHQCEAVVKLTKKHTRVSTTPDNGTDGYAIARRVRDFYDTMMCHMVVQDFSRLLTRNVNKMSAVSIRPTGGMYFVPEQSRDVLIKMRDVLEDIPGESHLCAIDIWGEQPDLARDTKIALEQELKDLQEEIKKFKAVPPRQDALKNRLQEYRELQEKGRMYSDLLNFNADQIHKGLEQCGKAVEAMFSEGHFKGSENQAKKLARKRAKTIRKVEEEPQKKVTKKKAASKKKRRVKS